MPKWFASFLLAIVGMAVTATMSAASIDEIRQRRAERATVEAQRGDEFLGKKEWDKAIEHYTNAISGCDKDCGKYLFRRGVAWQAKEDCAKALEDYQKAEETLKDNGELYYNQYLCFTKTNKTPEALAALDRSIVVNPNATTYHYARCIIRFNQQNYAGALPDCEQTLGPAPDDQTMLLATATSAEQTGDKAKAAKYYRHLLELDKNSQQAKDGLARVGG